MLRSYALPRRALALTAALGLLLASAIPALFGNPSASAAQLTDRSITLGSSVISTSNTYTVDFTTGASSTTDILGIVVDFCTNSPLVGQSCTAPAGMVTPTTGTVTVNAVAFDVDVDASGTDSVNGRLLLTHATGLTGLAGSDAVSFTFTATNPSALGTYYARIITLSTEAAVDAYTATAGPTTTGYIDNGGIALSTARQLTVNARVQEQLEFCVSAIDGTVVADGDMPANCGAMPSDTEVNLGVIDNTAPVPGTKGISPVPATNGGNDKNGGVMVRTNAVGGAVLAYRAEQNTSSGALKVPGATCNGTNTDQCFNSAGAAYDVITTSGEAFGMAVSATLAAVGGDTNNLTPEAEYDNAAMASGVVRWVDSGAATQFANTGGTVADYEMAVLRFGARAAATTPTGAYTVTSTYIATATF